MKFAKTLEKAVDTLPEEYKGQVLNYKKLKKSINRIVSSLESSGVYEIPENEECKVIYSLSNKDGHNGEIRSSLILYIDKDYVAKLTQKDALELNSEEITIDPKLKEMIELSDDALVEEEQLTKEKIIKSFQLCDNGKNEYTFNKRLSFNRFLYRCNSDDKSNRRNTLFEGSSRQTNDALKLKRCKSDGDDIENFDIEKILSEEEVNGKKIDEDETNPNVKDIQYCDELESSKTPVLEDTVSTSTVPMTLLLSSPSTLKASLPSPSTSTSSSPSTLQATLPSSSSSPLPLQATFLSSSPSSSSFSSTNRNDNALINISDTNINDNIKDNIPELNKSTNVISDDKNTNTEVNKDEEVDDVIDCAAESHTNLLSEEVKSNTMKSLMVLLDTDSQFLNELAASLTHLSAFQNEYKKVYETKITVMANILSEVSSPNMKDTYNWRELMSIYCESNIWKYRGKDRTPDEAFEQIKIFEGKMDGIRRKFKTKKSQNLYKEFIQLNYDIVTIKRFYELNQTAIYKILKKHDKRTHLLASEGFPHFARDETFFKENIVKSLIFQISSRLLKVIPNPADYYCPICQDIPYKPIRLECGHFFCLRCLLKAKKMNIHDCPMCREQDVVYNADGSRIDTKLMQKLKHDFPKEVKAKMIENKTEKAKEDSEALLRRYGYGKPKQCNIK